MTAGKAPLNRSAEAGYQLLDSGQQRKLEQFGAFVLQRPCSQAVWMPAGAATLAACRCCVSSRSEWYRQMEDTEYAA